MHAWIQKNLAFLKLNIIFFIGQQQFWKELVFKNVQFQGYLWNMPKLKSAIIILYQWMARTIQVQSPLEQSPPPAQFDFWCRRKPKCSEKTCEDEYGSTTKFTYNLGPTGNRTRAAVVKGGGTSAAPTRPGIARFSVGGGTHFLPDFYSVFSRTQKIARGARQILGF